MKKILILTLILACSKLGLSQQLPYFSQYMFNNYFINPAVAGSEENTVLSLSLRNQWLGFEGAPSTQTLSIHGSKNKKTGLGALFFNDRTGLLSKTGIQLTYAYHFQLKNTAKLSVGLSGMFYQHAVDKGNIKLGDPNDNAVQGEKERTIVPDAAFGLYYYSDKIHIGFSVPQLVQSRLGFNELSDSSKLNELVRHYFLTGGGYKFKINEDFDIEPSLLFKAIAQAPVQIDINAKITYKKLLWLGASYRNKESVVVMLGAAKNNFILGYSYDITLTSIRKHSSGSHEIYVGMKLRAFKKRQASVE